MTYLKLLKSDTSHECRCYHAERILAGKPERYKLYEERPKSERCNLCESLKRRGVCEVL